MSGAMANPDIARFTRDGVRHGLANSFELAPEIRRIDAARYVSEERYEAEMALLFRRLPLLLAPSCEIPAPGDFKTMDAAGVPLLLVRGSDGAARAFINACGHRGANVATEPCGNRRRFTCPYHGWTYDEAGRLIAVAAQGDFGEIDRAQFGLKPLPVAERAGLIFGILDPGSKLDIDGFLAGYDRMLDAFNLKHWHFFGSRTCEGPNWKISFDGYLDYYHLPVLHKNSFGRNAQLGNRALYRAWGPHQRLIAPDRAAAALGHLPESEWPDRFALIGVWTIFPGVAIATFDGGGRGVMISQVMPGDSAGRSSTRLIYLMEQPPTGEQEAAATMQFDFLQRVVIDEDYATGLRQQRALKSGALKHVLFGRNEGGQAVFHDWVDRILATGDADLDALFRASSAEPA